MPRLWFTLKEIVKLQLFGFVIIEACPCPTQDVLSLMAQVGQDSGQICRVLLDKPHRFLREMFYTEETINWNEESGLIASSVLKVRKIFASSTFSIPLEMNMCFLSLRLPDDDSFLVLWTHDLWIRGMVGKSLKC